jgi:hypothetical protein
MEAALIFSVIVNEEVKALCFKCLLALAALHRLFNLTMMIHAG